jgi:hypothetical protein
MQYFMSVLPFVPEGERTIICDSPIRVNLDFLAPEGYADHQVSLFSPNRLAIRGLPPCQGAMPTLAVGMFTRGMHWTFGMVSVPLVLDFEMQ